MRKGAKRIDWSVDDERYLLANAGKIPRREICRHLKRSSDSVYQKVKQLKAQGHNIELLYYQPKTRICTSCGCARSQFNKDDVCRPCELRQLISRCDYEISVTMQSLNAEDRATYEATETQLRSSADPRPNIPKLSNAPSLYARNKAEDEYALAIESWEIRNLYRLLKAKRRRLERMKKKI